MTALLSTARVNVRRVTIERAEGLASECGRPEAFLGPDALFFAGRRLGEWARTAPATGGYDKCDFRIEWVDGETYEGRADIQRKHFGALRGYDLAEHVRDALTFMGGRWDRERIVDHFEDSRTGRTRPDEAWARYQRFIHARDNDPADACAFLDTHKIGD